MQTKHLPFVTFPPRTSGASHPPRSLLDVESLVKPAVVAHGAWPSHDQQQSRLARRPPCRHCPRSCLHASCHVSLRRSAVPPRLSPAMFMLPHVAMPHSFASQVGTNRHSASIALDFHPRARPQLALAAASRLRCRLWLRQAAAGSRRVTLIAMVLRPAWARCTLYSAPPRVLFPFKRARMRFLVPLARGRRRPLPLRPAASAGVRCACFSGAVSFVLQSCRLLHGVCPTTSC